eukprot:CAMPEP_0201936000 /NCGR_PEP_ID=MMETSP0903-20130614/36627_1 /ASSEMBLY_ACC=CAM_ASM_000552 /TAXON_ID=420261 /ORGANISM="Thalassiosira antarctica, Strain CCMP982" /LENGTH=487 /DNA_ID=CAMNT_0048476585 /DNA_START=34 /DNA_END=1494 /DNA_ORIENTATION=+
MMKTSTTRRNPLLSPGVDKGGLKEKEYKEISHYCVEKTSTYIDFDGEIGWDTSWFVVSPERFDIALGLVKEDITTSIFGNKRDIQQLANKGRVLRTPSKQVVGGLKARVLVPEKKGVFQDKENVEGKRTIESSKKKKKKKEKDVEGKIVLRQKLAKSQKLIVGLQDELKQKDEQLLKRQTMADAKDHELKEMSDFMTTFQDLLQEMAGDWTDAEQLNISMDMENSSSSKKPNDAAAADAREGKNRDALEVTSEEHEKEATITQLQESLASQGSLIESLKILSVDSEKTMSSLTQLIHEKDQALVEIARVHDMNECFNKNILAHAHKQHQESMRVVRMKHEQENTKLLESLVSQRGLIDSLKSLNIEPAQTICSLMHLIGEKDTALAAMSHFNDMNNCANRKLLAHANEKHQGEMRKHKLRTKNLYSLISLQLREKLVLQRELALIKLQMKDGSIEIMDRQYLEEFKFVLATLAILAVLMALVWKHEW